MSMALMLHIYVVAPCCEDPVEIEMNPTRHIMKNIKRDL